MKFLLCLFLLLVSFFPSPSYSDDSENDVTLETLGIVKSTSGPPKITDEQIEESFQVADKCKVYNYTNDHYDCDCVGMNFLKLRQRAGDEVPAAELVSKAQMKCPNTPAMAGMIYKRCLTWAPMERGEDYEEFCSCYGSDFARIYSRYPSDDQLIREYQMTRALSNCNVNSVNQVKQDLQKMVKKLRSDKIYDELMPGAALSDNPIKPKRKEQ